MNRNSVLKIEHLDAGFKKKTILKNISIDVQAGELLALVGPNGSGKTTLIKTAASFLPPLKGKVFLEGREISSFKKDEKARQIAMIFQGQGIAWPFPVRDFILQGRFPHQGWFGIPPKSDEAIVEGVISEAGLDLFRNRLVTELSGGEYQRVLLARAMAQESSLFLLDEPVSYLDLKYQLTVMDLIRHSVDRGIAAMVSLHDLNLAALYADRIALVAEGTIIALGTAQEVLTREFLERAFNFPVPVGSHPWDSNIPEIFYPLKTRRD